jgi:putative transposase
MPRAPRVEFAGAIYHVMNRGNHLENIFRDDKDREVFVKTLGETCESSGWVVHSFVLMRNHYHLLIETSRSTLVKGMQYLNSTYTRRYNVRHKTFGHLFQGRYKALLVDGEATGYFLTVSDYIHMNPVRVKKVVEGKELLKDLWSSAGWLTGVRKKRPEWLRWERVYGELGLSNWRRGSRREYRSYLERRVGEVNSSDETWKSIRRGWCLGSEGFVAEMKGKLEELREIGDRQGDSWAGEAVEAMEEDLAQRFLRKGFQKLGLKEGERLKKMDAYLLARWVRGRTKVGVKWVANELGVGAGTLSHGIWKIGTKIESDRKLRTKWKILQN